MIMAFDNLPAGRYDMSMDVVPSSNICNLYSLKLGFTLPAADKNPPRVTKFLMPQRFASGGKIPINISVVDDRSASVLAISWRSGPSGSWNALSLIDLGAGNYSASIQTALSDSLIDLRYNVTDASGNYLTFTQYNASIKDVPVLFDLVASANATQIEYKDMETSIELTGYLKSISGSPLHSYASVPLELKSGSRKLGMILDDYMTGISFTHNGSIRFDWHLNPTLLFTGPDQTIPVTAVFDLGAYQPINRTFSLHSIYATNRFCIDGTPFGQCATIKPLYCNNAGTLLQNCSFCGCTSPYVCNTDLNYCQIVTQTCSDGTPYGSCSATKPKYCSNGALVDRCAAPENCGCPSGMLCNSTNKSCYTGQPPAPNNPPDKPQPFLVSSYGTNTTLEDLTCSAQVSDADGDSMNATTYWYNNSSLYAVNQYNNLSSGNFSTATIKSGNLSAGQKWQCKMIVTDGKANSTWGESNNLTIRNPPGVNSPPNTPQPSLVSYDGSNTVSSDLLCYDTIADIDNDRMNATVVWYKGGVLNSTTNHNNNYPSLYNFNVSLKAGNLTVGDIWQCSIRLSDGKNYSGIGYSSNLTIVAPPVPPVTQSPTGGGGGGGGGWTPPVTNVTTQPQQNISCVNSLEVTVPQEIFVPQGVTKDISIIVKNTGTCPLSSVSAVLSLPQGWQANSYTLDSGLGVNETGIMSIRLMPLYSPIGNYPVTVRLDAPNVTMSKSAKVWLLENPPYVVSQEGPSASRIFEYIIALILIEFVFGSIVMVVWYKPPEEKLPPLPKIGSDLKPVEKEPFRFR